MRINLEELKIQFSNREILKGISLEFPDGKFTGLIGPNGSGKSTMLKCVYRILQPASGAIYLDGKALEKYSVRETARKQAVLAQHNYYNFDFEVLDVVLMGRSPYKKAMEADNEEDYAIARECLDVVGMGAFAHSSFALLSGGEQQRIMLARALAQKTECLILDEPTNHLDIKYQLQLLNIVKSRKLTVVAALHDLNIAAAYCDILVAMKNGRIIKIGTPQEVLTSEFIFEMYEVESEIIKRSDGKILIAYK